MSANQQFYCASIFGTRNGENRTIVVNCDDLIELMAFCNVGLFTFSESN